MFNPVKVTDVTLRDGLEDFVLRHLRLDDLGRLVGESLPPVILNAAERSEESRLWVGND